MSLKSVKNRLYILSAQLVRFEVLYQILERTVGKIGPFTGMVFHSWSHFGEKLGKGVVILALISFPSFYVCSPVQSLYTERLTNDNYELRSGHLSV